MAHIHFAWELGGGLGHAGRLKPLAEEALRRGHQVTLSLRDLTQTQALLAGLNVPLFQAPVWLHQVRGIPAPQISLAEILQGCGYLNADTLRGLFKGWSSLFQTLQPDLVVADYAPTALLAARALNLRHASIGIGFYLPPAGSALPNLRDWEAAQPGRLQSAEAQVLQAANTVLWEAGSAPLAMACELLNGPNTLLQSWPELDHFQRKAWPADQRWWGPSVSAPGGMVPTWPAPANSQTNRVFAYLKASHPDHEQVLRALVSLGCSTLCYLPEVASGKAPPVASPLIHYATQPVDLALALPDSILCICHAGEATLAQALLAGVPVFMLPTQSEQFLLARSVETTGAGLNSAARKQPQDYVKAIGSMLGESRYRDAARAFAAKYQGFSALQQTRDLVDEFERLVG